MKIITIVTIIAFQIVFNSINYAPCTFDSIGISTYICSKKS